MSKPGYHYCLLSVRFGQSGIVWLPDNHQNIIHRVFLPGAKEETRLLILGSYPEARSSNSRDINETCDKIVRYFEGEKPDFTIEGLAISQLAAFQRTVLIAERHVPYGRVASYGHVAKRIGMPGAARAVGQALAQNPFPIIIPCHRTVKSDGSIGGFQRGSELKRHMLELEGIIISDNGKVASEFMV